MTATTRAAAAGPILAIDLGKYKSVACAYDPATAEVAFASFDTTRDERSLVEYGQVLEQVAAIEAVLDGIGRRSRPVQLLMTIPGVGPRTAEAVAAYLNDPKRFATAKEVSAYAGLVPRQFQSGELDRRGRITRRGPAILRKLLVECAWCSLRYNAWARQVYLRLSHNGTARKKQAIVALARKLLVRCWAVLRDGMPWREPLPV